MAQKLTFPVHIPFADELGLELWAFGEGKAELRMDLGAVHLNSRDVAHGGVLMTMLDVVMAHAAKSIGSRLQNHDPEQARAVVTIEMKTSFMRPAEGPLRALGTLLHHTTGMAFTEGRIVDAQDRLCAQASGTFKYVRALPGAPRNPPPLPRSPG